MEIYFNIFFITITLIPIITLYKAFQILNNFIADKHRELLFNRFSELLAIFVYSKENSFKSLYKQKISVLYTSKSDIMSKKEELSKLEKIFIKRTIEMCGTNIIKDLSDIYGGTDALIRDLSEYYYSKIIQLEAGTMDIEDGEDDYDDNPKIKNNYFIK